MSKRHFLEFEQPIAELESKIDELRYVQNESAVDISDEIDRLGQKSQQLTKDIYSSLTPWQVTQIARHPQRPYTLDYVGEIFTDFQELHGDRNFADDLSIVGGLARFNGQACMVLGHQKGRDTKERGLRNFGMARPEGYRKALRLMKLAEKFGLPVFTFVDTPGAYPGIGAEERGQSEAIGRNIFEMAQLEVPIITTIIGEGGSGGALAISVADQVLMLQYSVYSVISPEGCASILWKTAERASDAAEALGITAHRLKALGVIDKIVSEPVGGAHRDPKQMAAHLKRALNDALRQVRRPEAQGTAAAPLRAPAVLRPLHRHQGALSAIGGDAAARRGGRQRRPRLDGAAARHRACGAAARRLEVVALHVHHGLLPAGRRLGRAGAAPGAALGGARPAGQPALRRLHGAPARGRERRGLGAARALPRAGRDGARTAARHRAAGPPPPRPGRDLPAAGPARRRRRPGWRRCRARRSATASPGRGPGWSSRARRSRPMCGAIACASSTTPATPTRASRATACAQRSGRR